MCYFVLLLLLLSWVPGVQSETRQPIVGGVSRTTFGVDFNFLFQLNNMHGSWKHAWVIDLGLLHRPSLPPPTLECPKTLNDICHAEQEFLNDVSRDLWQMVQNTTKAQDWISNPQILETVNRLASGRSKRSWFPFVGDIEKTLFGIATEQDVASVKSMIDDMTKLAHTDYDQITKLGDNLASVSKMFAGQTLSTKKGFETVKHTFENLTESINNRFKFLVSQISDSTTHTDQLRGSIIKQWIILEGYNQLLTKVMTIMQDDATLIRGIQSVMQGYIPIDLIPPEILTSGLDVASRGIKKTFPEGDLTYGTNTLGYYYTHKIVTPIISQDQLILVADLPVDLGQQILNAYMIRTYPVPLLPYNLYTHEVDPSSLNSHAVSELNLKNEVFLIAQDGQRYSEARPMDLLSCKGDVIRVCQTQFPLYTMDRPSCSALLWKDSTFEKILSHCPYELSHVSHATQTEAFIQVIPLSTGRWYIVAPLTDTWTVVCPQRPPESRKPCTSCIIKVDCGCGINSRYFSIPTRVSSCDSVFSPLTRNFSINPFGYLPKSQPWIINLTGSDGFSSPRPDMPDITLPSADNWDDVMESMDKTSYDMNRLYLKQQNETKMYRSSAEALMEKIKSQDQLISSFSTWPEWVIGPAIVLVYVDTGVILLIILCVFIRGARAVPILSRFEGEPSIGDSGDESLISLDVLILIIVIIILSLQVIMVWPTIHAWWRSSSLVRRLTHQVPRVYADGFVQRRGALLVGLNGMARFAFGGMIRQIPIQIALSTLRQETHLQTFPDIPDYTDVSQENDVYTLQLNQGFSIINSSDQVIAVRRFSISPRKLIQSYSIPDRYILTEISQIAYFTEVNP